jgi:hypothetical protein
MTSTYKGSCRCGAVRYQLHGHPHRTGLCHCTDCRKETGSAFFYYGDWRPDQFSVTGAYTTYEGRSFCRICGTRLFHISPDHVEIALGSLDEAPVGLVPDNEGWIKRREPWLAPVPGARQHREDLGHPV